MDRIWVYHSYRLLRVNSPSSSSSENVPSNHTQPVGRRLDSETKKESFDDDDDPSSRPHQNIVGGGGGGGGSVVPRIPTRKLARHFFNRQGKGLMDVKTVPLVGKRGEKTGGPNLKSKPKSHANRDWEVYV